MDFNSLLQSQGVSTTGSSGGSSSTPTSNSTNTSTSNPTDFNSLMGQSTQSAPQTPSTGYSPAAQAQGAMGALKSGVQNIFGSIKNAFTGGIQQGVQGYQQLQNSGGNPITSLEGVGKLGMGTISALTSPFAPITAPVGKFLANPSPNSLLGHITSSPSFQNFAQSPAGQTTARVASDVNNYAGIAGAVAGIGNAPEVANQTGTLASNASDKLGQGIGNIQESLTKSPEEITAKTNSNIQDLYNRAIKPSVVGKSTAGAIEKANTNVISGVRAIADNKPNLSFTGADGETITGATPKSVDQLSQAIDQTKSSIFAKYDALAKQAGGQGVAVDTTKIASELDPVINSKSLAIANPKAIEYAKATQDRLNQVGSVDASTAQDVIQHYNNALKAFYKNPSYDTASTASIDALVANKFRSSLDEGITGATGSQYQALKSQYGALASMEKDVAHRNVVWSRQNNVGLAGNLANITSGAELARGLVTMNPADIGASLAIKGVQKYMKYLNNPDVGVSKIFSEIDKSSPLSTGSTQVLKAGNTGVQSSPKLLKSNK